MARKRELSDKEKLQEACDHLTMFLNKEPEYNAERAQKAYDAVDSKFLRKMGAQIAWTNAMARVADQRVRHLPYHLKRLKEFAAPVANDFPFEVGNRVAICRCEHGWYDGRVTAVITGRYQNQDGIWSYSAIAETEGYEGITMDIRHTRDAYRIG